VGEEPDGGPHKGLTLREVSFGMSTMSEAMPPPELMLRRTSSVHRLVKMDPKELPRNSYALAMAIMASASFMYSLQSLNVKLLGSRSGFWTISFFRGVSGMILAMCSGYMSKYREGPIWGKRENVRWLVLRGILGAVTIIAFFAALTVRAGRRWIPYQSPCVCPSSAKASEWAYRSSC
jgi:hypothetical protein